MKKSLNKKSGQIVIMSVLLFVFVGSIIIYGIAGPLSNRIRLANKFNTSKQNLYVTESVIEDSLYRLKNSINLGSANTIVINKYTATATITGGSKTKTVVSQGINNGDSKKIQGVLDKVSNKASSWSATTWNEVI